MFEQKLFPPSPTLVHHSGVCFNHLPGWLLFPCLLRNLFPGFQRRCWGLCHCPWTPGSWWDHSLQTVRRKWTFFLNLALISPTFVNGQNWSLTYVCVSHQRHHSPTPIIMSVINIPLTIYSTPISHNVKKKKKKHTKKSYEQLGMFRSWHSCGLSWNILYHPPTVTIFQQECTPSMLMKKGDGTEPPPPDNLHVLSEIDKPVLQQCLFSFLKAKHI